MEAKISGLIFSKGTEVRTSSMWQTRAVVTWAPAPEEALGIFQASLFCLCSLLIFIQTV